MLAAALQERLTVIVNPRAAAANPNAWTRLRESLLTAGDSCTEIETRADRANVERIGRAITEHDPNLVIAAGGDGTVADVVQAVMDCGAAVRPRLVIIPLGTANNVARSIGMQSCRNGGRTAVDLALHTIIRGRDRAIDLGRAGDRYFIGSCALGMDADILSLRERISRRVQSRPLLKSVARGYPLYLWSCAANLFRAHGGPLHMSIDGRSEDFFAYNVLITNASIYAGEFRFVGGDPSDDGFLDLQAFRGAADYVATYSAAWIRHLRAARGALVSPSQGLMRMRQADLRFDSSVGLQLDGEELPAVSALRVSVVPSALRVRIPTT